MIRTAAKSDLSDRRTVDRRPIRNDLAREPAPKSTQGWLEADQLSGILPSTTFPAEREGFEPSKSY